MQRLLPRPWPCFFKPTLARNTKRMRLLGVQHFVLALVLSLQACRGQPDLRRAFQDETERVTMGPFSVKLAPTPLPLEPEALDSLYVYIQDTLVKYMKGRTDNNGLTVRYFVMTDIGVQEMEGNVSTLRIGEGAAAFDGRADLVPAPQQIEDWLRQAIDTELVNALQETEFYYVQQARFVSLPETVVGGVQEEDSVRPRSNGNDSNDSRADAALTASVAVAGAAIVLLGALLVRSYQQREVRSPASLGTTAATSTAGLQHAPETTVPSVTVTSAPPAATTAATLATPVTPTRLPSYAPPDEEASSPLPPSRTPSRMDDTRSLADSESSWTVATEMGDSAALHSVATHPSQALVSTESFEHERQVYLQKDMLTTSWSGQNVMGAVPHSDSVLQPSHFSASHERRGRRQWVDTDESPRPFIFASHDDADLGEEVFLMPEDCSSSRGGNGGGPHAELL